MFRRIFDSVRGRGPGLAAVLALALPVFAGGCSREITSLQRKEAASVASEGQFAIQIRDWPRAEDLFAKACELCPDSGDYWLNLGIARLHKGNRNGARSAYRSAADAYEVQAKRTPDDAYPVIRRVLSLALIGRADEARRYLESARSRAPQNRDVKAYIESRQLDRLLTDRGFREIAVP